MAEYPYTSNVGRLRSFIEKLEDAKAPPKVTIRTLEALGFKSRNDRTFIGILKALGMLDQGGTPTELWTQMRDKSQSAAVMAAAMRSTYGELFSLYPDAHRKDKEALRNFFSTHTNVGKGALDYMVQTFKALAEMAEFDTATPSKNVISLTTPDVQGDKVVVSKGTAHNASGLTINLNIQLTIPETNDPKTYDLFFQALKKHLLSDI